MQFNAEKCYVMHITNKRNPLLTPYHFCGQVLETTKAHPYLGVTLTTELKWSTHIDKVTAKAKQTLGVIKRNLWSCPTKVKSLAYTSLVRPHLEYAATVWDPHTKKDKEKLERVQNQAARFCMNDYDRNTSVTKLKGQLQWNLLEERRKKARLCMMYKMNNKLVDVPTTKYLVPAQKRTRGSHDHKFQSYQPRIEAFKNSFFPRTITDWNMLSSSTVEAPSLDSFKQRLELDSNGFGVSSRSV